MRITGVDLLFAVLMISSVRCISLTICAPCSDKMAPISVGEMPKRERITSDCPTAISSA